MKINKILYINWNKGRKLWSIFDNIDDPPLYMVKNINIKISSCTDVQKDSAYIKVWADSILFWNINKDKMLDYNRSLSDEIALLIYK